MGKIKSLAYCSLKIEDEKREKSEMKFEIQD